MIFSWRQIESRQLMCCSTCAFTLLKPWLKPTCTVQPSQRSQLVRTVFRLRIQLAVSTLPLNAMITLSCQGEYPMYPQTLLESLATTLALRRLMPLHMGQVQLSIRLWDSQAMAEKQVICEARRVLQQFPASAMAGSRRSTARMFAVICINKSLQDGRCVQLIIKMIVVDIFIAIMPVYAYYSQLQLIRQQKSIGSFSIYVTAILLIANILRVYFWLTIGFATNLLFQSIFLIAIMLVLLKECVALSDHSAKAESLVQRFWKWETFEEYVKFLLALTAGMTIFTLILQLFSLESFGQVIGFLSMSIEATLGFPQLISNWKTKSVKGLSYTMIGMWFLGDLSKTLYFISEAQPVQFVMCGVIQLTTDTLIILQIFNYSRNDYSSIEGAQRE